jgi:hypothetical protein
MSIDEGMDRWAAWVLHRRDGDDQQQREKAWSTWFRSATGSSTTRAYGTGRRSLM